MFKAFSDRVNGVFDKLKGKGSLSEKDIDDAMREVRIALLEADVALPVAKDFINQAKEKIVGSEIVKSVSPAQMVIKLVQDQLTESLGGENADLNIKAQPPVVIMMVGLQGSGKTTSSAKLSKFIKEKLGKKPLLASLDVYRPAAQKQLEVVATQVGVDSVEIVEKEKPEAITKRALKQAELSGYDILILDTAGRLNIDDEMMSELERVKKLAKPTEILLVADSLTGQDAVNIAKDFNDRLDITGIILTRIDGDGRGGAALSMKTVTGRPIKFMGTGEKLDEFEEFHPERIASRILDKGDVVTLVEKAVDTIDQEEAKKLEKKLKKGKFDLNDLKKQLKQMEKMGGLSGIMGFLPGMGKIKEKFGDKLDEATANKKIITHQTAIIDSMTAKERENPKIINGSRKIRIASGCGLTVPEINKLLKTHRQMQDMMKKLKGGGKAKMMAQLKNMMGDGGFPQ